MLPMSKCQDTANQPMPKTVGQRASVCEPVSAVYSKVHTKSLCVNEHL